MALGKIAKELENVVALLTQQQELADRADAVAQRYADAATHLLAPADLGEFAY